MGEMDKSAKRALLISCLLFQSNTGYQTASFGSIFLFTGLRRNFSDQTVIASHDWGVQIIIKICPVTIFICSNIQRFYRADQISGQLFLAIQNRCFWPSKENLSFYFNRILGRKACFYLWSICICRTNRNSGGNKQTIQTSPNEPVRGFYQILTFFLGELVRHISYKIFCFFQSGFIHITIIINDRHSKAGGANCKSGRIGKG